MTQHRYDNYWNPWRTQDPIHQNPFGEGERLVILSGNPRNIPHLLVEKFGENRLTSITSYVEMHNRLPGYRGDVLIHRKFPGLDQYMSQLFANPNLRVRDVSDEHAKWTLWVLFHLTDGMELHDIINSSPPNPGRNDNPDVLWAEVQFARWCYHYGIF